MSIKSAAIVLLAVTTAVAAGFWMGRHSLPKESAPVSSVDSPAAEVVAQCPSASTDAATATEQLPLCRSRYAGMGPVDLLALPTDFEQTVALYTVAAEADVAGLQDLIEQAVAIPIEGEREAALSILYMRYSDLDPDGAIDHMYKLGLEGHTSVLFVMFNGWAKTDLDGAIARSHKLRSTADRRQANSAILRAHASEDPAELAAIESRLQDFNGSYQPRALAHRARTEPLAAMAAALAISNPQVQRQAVRWIASVWGEQDAAAALAYGEQIADAGLRQEFRSMALARMAQSDPLAALRQVGNGSPEEDQMLISTAMGVLAQRNPQQALLKADQLSEGAQRRAGRVAVMQSWSQTDPRAAALALESMTDLGPEEREQLGFQVAFAFGRAEPEAALAWAERMDRRKGSLWQTTLNSVVQHDPQLGLSLVASLPSSTQQAEMLSNLMNTVARTDPALAIAQLEHLPEGEMRARAISGIAGAWIQNDPIATMDWLMLQPEHSRQQAMQNVVWRLASQDPLLAASYVNEVQGESRRTFINAVVDQLTRKDPAEAGAWVAQYKDEPQYGYWIGTVASGYLPENPRAGVKLLTRLEDEQFRDALPQFISAWARHAPREAARWWHRIDEDRQPDQALHQLVSTWQQYDQKAAQKWVLNLTNTHQRDQALTALVGNQMLDPEDVRRLIERIDDPDMRFSTFSSQIWQLARYDRGRAEDWIRSARVSTDQRDQLLQQLEQMAPTRRIGN